MTGHASLIGGVCRIVRQDRAAAAVAEHMRPLAQPVADADAVVEDKAIAFPRAFLFGHLFEVLQDAAFEVKDILNPLTDQIIG